MALNIKSAETEQLARKVAALTGDSITEAVRKGLELRLAQATAEREAEYQRRLAAIRAIQDRVAAKGGIPAITKADIDAMWEECFEDEP